MRLLSTASAARAAKFDRTKLLDANDCSVLTDIALVLWPENTAACIADEADCSVRVVEMYLAGDRKWSGDALAVIVTEILKRHAMRNVRIRAR